MWSQIPLPIEGDTDRRDLCAILVSAGMEVRIVRIRETPRAPYKKYVEYRLQE